MKKGYTKPMLIKSSLTLQAVTAASSASTTMT